jgi:hypothetical protein
LCLFSNTPGLIQLLIHQVNWFRDDKDAEWENVTNNYINFLVANVLKDIIPLCGENIQFLLMGRKRFGDKLPISLIRAGIDLTIFIIQESKNPIKHHLI